MIWAGNELIGKPYIWGGGHASFFARGYDCSGTVSYALHSAGLLTWPEVSGELESFGGRGVGHWVTIFANAGHVYMTIAGIRLDTSPAYDPTNLEGPRWRPLMPGNPVRRTPPERSLTARVGYAAFTSRHGRGSPRERMEE